MRIATDIHGMKRVAGAGNPVTCLTGGNRWLRNLRLAVAAARSDYLIVHFELDHVIFFAVFLALVPGHRCRMVTLDMFLPRVRPWLRPVTRWALRRVARFMVYFKDVDALAEKFAIPKDRFHYVPFKINRYETIVKTKPCDDGYIFCGGRSRRDFTTFFQAVETLGYPVKLLTGTEAEINIQGSSLAGLRMPSNVERLGNDADMDYFVRVMAGARLVVLPLARDSGVQAGIGVYLMAMALRKCVIVSESLGVSDVLTDQAIVIPAGDAAALRRAIQTAWENPALREEYAGRGYRYAMPLGGEDRLRQSILEALPAETDQK